jgi:hypothetical protein
VRHEKGRPATGRPSANPAPTTAPKLTAESSGHADIPGLFDAVVEQHAYGRTTTFVMSEYATGPGPRPATTGVADAGAPPWWWDEAERTVMTLIDSGHQVTSDDLHERFPDEPSASGAAFGGLFARLARQGRIREVGMVKSRRPEARRRRIILWGAPS